MKKFLSFCLVICLMCGSLILPGCAESTPLYGDVDGNGTINATDNRGCKPVFVPIKEENGTLQGDIS